jgi:Predicted membrane protein
LNRLWTKIKLWLLGPQRVQQVESWSKKVSLPGFSQVPIYNIVTFIYAELKKDDIVTRANSVAYTFFLSIFPFVIFVLPIITFHPWVTAKIETFESNLQGLVPDYAISYALEIIDGIKPEGIFGIQSVGFLFAALFASSGMLSLMYGFDKSYEISFRSRSYLKKRWVAFNLTILLSLILIVAIIFMVVGQTYFDYLIDTIKIGFIQSVIFMLIKWLVVFLLFYLVITIIYRYGPSIYRPLKFINPGAIIATIFSVVATSGFFYFLNNFGRYNEIYGSIATLIIILLWLQINAFIILAGFELNASIIVNRDAQILEE